MKRAVFSVLIAAMLLIANCAYAVKARGIATDAESTFHYEHLQQHLYDASCRGTGNYLKVRKQAKPSDVRGHLEQADQFILMAFSNGYAKVSITYSDSTSPDSYIGLEGWVDADYIDCACSWTDYQNSANINNRMAAGGVFPEGMPKHFTVAGAGAWATFIQLSEDGTFVGDYHDSDMGVSDAVLYPKGTQYFCNFRGRFTDVRQIEPYAYSMRLVDLTDSGEGDHISDGIRYIASYPYGLDGGDSFILYTPDTPLDVLPEAFLNWISPMHFDFAGNVLGGYAIRNCAMEYGLYQE